jgi:microsomal dipeptidase-like Zn-dependent dipeptidase
MGQVHIVVGSDYCGGLGALNKAFNGVSGLVDPERFKRFTDKNSRANPP